MHYKNGREAKNGDKVVIMPSYGVPVSGILYDAVAGNDTCNGRVAIMTPIDPCPNLQEVLHLDDFKAMVASSAATAAAKPAGTDDQIRFGNENPIKD